MPRLSAVSDWARERRAKRAAWDRYRVSIDVVDEARKAYALAPNEMTAEQLRHAEIEHGDAIALAGEFEAMNMSWPILGTRRDESFADENQPF